MSQRKKVGMIKTYPEHEGREYSVIIEFYDDGSVDLKAEEGTPQHIIQEAKGYIVQGICATAEKEVNRS